MTVVAFLVFPSKTESFNLATLQGQVALKCLRETTYHLQNVLGQSLFEKCLRGEMPTAGGLLNQDLISKLKKALFPAKRDGLPPICTHNIVDNDHDDILNALRRCRLFNNRYDRVKVVFHPEFLSSTNPLFGLDYEDFVRGCNLGIFPSYYDPWGYTPAECTVMGIPSITSNLAGYGCFIEEHITDPKSYGVHVIDRRNQGWDQSAQQLAQTMFDFTCLTKRQRIVQRNRTEHLSDLIAWKNLAVYYRKARSMGLARAFPEDFTEVNYSKPHYRNGSMALPRTHSQDFTEINYLQPLKKMMNSQCAAPRLMKVDGYDRPD